MLENFLSQTRDQVSQNIKKSIGTTIKLLNDMVGGRKSSQLDMITRVHTEIDKLINSFKEGSTNTDDATSTKHDKPMFWDRDAEHKVGGSKKKKTRKRRRKRVKQTRRSR